ncbi:MAG: hypothetical protein GWP09_00410 [Nitrospiraceae bacterium]|nr:hypothetical protein [Nitrospiraceae bacterium]
MSKNNSGSGAICGGLIPESIFRKHLKDGTIDEIMMAYILPDKYFKEYQEAYKSGDKKKAKKIFSEHAFSII